MSDSGKPVKAVIRITLYEDDTLDFSGPISNRVVCYGMLEYAKDAIFEKSIINNAKPNGVKSMLNGLRKLRGK